MSKRKSKQTVLYKEDAKLLLDGPHVVFQKHISEAAENYQDAFFALVDDCQEDDTFRQIRTAIQDASETFVTDIRYWFDSYIEKNCKPDENLEDKCIFPPEQPQVSSDESDEVAKNETKSLLNQESKEVFVIHEILPSTDEQTDDTGTFSVAQITPEINHHPGSETIAAKSTKYTEYEQDPTDEAPEDHNTSVINRSDLSEEGPGRDVEELFIDDSGQELINDSIKSETSETFSISGQTQITTKHTASNLKSDQMPMDNLSETGETEGLNPIDTIENTQSDVNEKGERVLYITVSGNDGKTYELEVVSQGDNNTGDETENEIIANAVQCFTSSQNNTELENDERDIGNDSTEKKRKLEIEEISREAKRSKADFSLSRKDASGKDLKPYMIRSALDRLDIREHVQKLDDNDDEVEIDLAEASKLDLTTTVKGLEFSIAPKFSRRKNRNNMPTPEANILCEICGKAFALPRNLTKHKNLEHPHHIPHQCAVCYMACSSAKALRRHFLLEHKESSPFFMCPTCGYEFKYHDDFKKHLVNKCNYKPEDFGYEAPVLFKQGKPTPGANLPFKCKFCMRGFKDKKALSKHLVNSHLRYQPGSANACDLCEKQFLEHESLLKHNLSASHTKQLKMKLGITEEEKESSSQGAFGYTNLSKKPKTYKRGTLKRMGGKKLHMCEICGKEFERQSSLYIHVAAHKKAFECHICKHRLNSKPQLNIHMRLHTGETPYMCDHCGKGFRSHKHLHSHTNSMHSNSAYKCLECGSIFKHVRNLDAHVRKKHGDAALQRFREAGTKGLAFTVKQEELREKRLNEAIFMLRDKRDKAVKSNVKTQPKKQAVSNEALLGHRGRSPIDQNYDAVKTVWSAGVIALSNDAILATEQASLAGGDNHIVSGAHEIIATTQNTVETGYGKESGSYIYADGNRFYRDESGNLYVAESNVVFQSQESHVVPYSEPGNIVYVDASSVVTSEQNSEVPQLMVAMAPGEKVVA